MAGHLIVISGPSGVGKSTIVKRLVERLDGKISVSATTRPRSEQEIDGRDYYFLTPAKFRQMIDDDSFLEWAEYLGNLYGTPSEPVFESLNAGTDVILEIEVEGGKQVAKRFSDAIMIYLLSPDDEELKKRLVGRNRDEDADIERRFENAKREIEQARNSGVYDHWVVNRSVEQAVNEIVEIVRKRN